MNAARLLPRHFRGEQPGQQVAPTTPPLGSKAITSILQPLSRLTASHPMQTIVIGALLASTSYIGLLEDSLFDVTRSVRKAEWLSLIEGSRSLRAGPETAWKWQLHDNRAKSGGDVDHFALLTLVFPETLATGSPKAPVAHMVPIPDNLSVSELPSTSNSFTTYSQDFSLAFAIPYSQAAEFLSVSQEIPHDDPSGETRESEYGDEKKMWIMKAARVQTRSSLARWVRNSWAEFMDLLKNTETLDIVIMCVGYLAMHLTFVSLFYSMRRLGSNFWLATSVLLSSTFAFLFGLFVTTSFGVPVTMVLLSEGLPFLVVIIGFEKNIALTRSVLSHALMRSKPSQKDAKSQRAGMSRGLIQSAIEVAIKETGPEIVKDYAMEVGILVIGALSGIQGGLRQFCFLAAWILFFDCLLLFTFYVAILCIKLEINRIKRHVEMRKALEDDGLSRRVAESVAQSNDWPRTDGRGEPGTTIFGRQIKSTHIYKFKFFMVGGFFLVNIANLVTLPFRSGNSLSSMPEWAHGLGDRVVTSPPVDPFKVAGNGLEILVHNAQAAGREIIVTVLTPIKYELEFPSVHYDLPKSKPSRPPSRDGAYAELHDYGMSGRMVGSILKSIEDPVLSKWIVVALALSIGLNGYLFNAARWGIKDPNLPEHPIDPTDLAQAQRFNDTESATLTLDEYQAAAPPIAQIPLTPASTDDEAEGLLNASPTASSTSHIQPARPRLSAAEAERLLAEKRTHELGDEDIIALCLRGKLPGYALEKTLTDFTRAVKIRRSIISRAKATSELTGNFERSKLPYERYDWAKVYGACCENVVGYMPIPVGVAGPLVINGKSYMIPMATTEGVLVASASRGCKAINAGGGAVAVLTQDGMTRGPCVRFETLERAGAAKLWLDSDEGQAALKKAFNSTSRFARLQSLKTAIAGTYLYIRFKTTTGDAMGMNMISKGVEHALNFMANEAGFDDMNIITVSGNFCTDKKPAAINWIEGRGKSVVAEAIIPGEVVQSVLKTSVDAMVELGVAKNLIGSAMAGSVGGFNAHAANMVAAIFIATGQDPAQVVESANCITIMKKFGDGLQISVSMPSIEVGTLGGGTILEPQGAMLDMLGVRGPHPTKPGDNAQQLSRIVAAAVLAGELSLCSALAAGHLVEAHMAHNRSAPATRPVTPAPNGSATSVGLAMTNTLEKMRGGARS